MAKLILYTRIRNYKADTISDSLLKEKIQIYEIRQLFMIGSSFFFLDMNCLEEKSLRLNIIFMNILAFINTVGEMAHIEMIIVFCFQF